MKLQILDVNVGSGKARNESIAMASGRYIAFVDSDDTWMPDKLERQIDFMSDGKAFSFTAYQIMDSRGTPTGKTVDATNFGSFDYEDILRKKATIGCSTVMLDATAIESVAMPDIRTGQDYALWLKLLRSGHSAHLLPEVLTSYRITPNSISRNKVRKALRQWEIYREHEKLPFLQSSACFAHYAYRALVRRP